MKKMDEMEQAHALQGIRMTFLYSIIVEVVYWLVECFKAQALVTSDSFVFFLIITQGVVLTLSHLFFKRKVADPKGIKGIVVAGIFALIALLIGFVLLKLGV